MRVVEASAIVPAAGQNRQKVALSMTRKSALPKRPYLGRLVFWKYAGSITWCPSGKIAVLGDPQGAAFAVFEGETDE